MTFDGTNKVKIRLPEDVKRAAGEFSEQDEVENNARTQMMPTGNSVKKARSINLQEYLDQNLAELKEQLNNYQEVCARFSAGTWNLVEVVDYLYVLIKSLNFDALSVMLTDSEHPGSFLPMVSRGYQNPPTLELEQFWKESLKAGGAEIDWEHLLQMTQMEKSPLEGWIEAEGIHRIGYSPIQDGSVISGFMIIATYDDKKLSPLASVLLELCSGHIGLAMTARRARTSLRPDSARKQLLELKQMLQSLTQTESLTVDDLVATLAQSQNLIDDVLSKID